MLTVLPTVPHRGQATFPKEDGPMPKTTMRKCPSCDEWFHPDPYNAYQQEYCGKAGRA